MQGQDGVVLGGVDVQNVEAVPPTEVVGDVGEGRASCLGHAVVDHHRVIGRAQRRGHLTPGLATPLLLLRLRPLAPGHGSLWNNTVLLGGRGFIGTLPTLL